MTAIVPVGSGLLLDTKLVENAHHGMPADVARQLFLSFIYMWYTVEHCCCVEATSWEQSID